MSRILDDTDASVSYTHLQKDFEYGKRFEAKAKAFFGKIPDKVYRDKKFGNVRMVRNLYERVWNNALTRQMCIRDRTKDGRQIFVMGHPEYDRVTLDGEYKRDMGKGLPIEQPKNYYPENNSDARPMLMWRAHANNLYTNWLNYYVYQITPYSLNKKSF